MAPRFGTSGLRGLVKELTPDLITAHVRAFALACPMGTGLWVGRDLRDSSPDMAKVVVRAGQAMGLAVTDCGAVPTPALALSAMRAGAAAIMVTGSHIPADRNGMKFYLPDGEIAKADEAAILKVLDRPAAAAAAAAAAAPGPGPAPVSETGAGPRWIARYVTAFGPLALAGLRIGVWSHSAVSRDLLLTALPALGAQVTDLGRSDSFIPVDTEAVPPWARDQLAAWAAGNPLDAILSTDGDGDRPLLTDATGRIVPGDILGQITAQVLAAATLVTPVSSNTGAEAIGPVIRTRIGSPFVIEGMAQAGGRVVGYEANGGFLLGFDATGPAGPLPALATRDSLLPLVATLSQARAAGGVAALVARQPARFTASDRVEDIPPATSAALIATLQSHPAELAAFLSDLGEAPASRNLTDGLRLTLQSGRILHLRPSGNAPELRIYIEAEHPDIAADLARRGMALLRSKIPA